MVIFVVEEKGIVLIFVLVFLIYLTPHHVAGSKDGQTTMRWISVRSLNIFDGVGQS
jgi:hypothetical protein